MATVSLKGIKKAFSSVYTLHGIDLEIKDGEFIVFVGPSGCGKSTLLRTIAGLEDITDGEMCIDGLRVNELPPVKRGISMVFQSYALYPHMDVFENLAFGLKLAGMKKAEYTPLVERVAKVLQIEPLLRRKPRDMSGGQRQRVAIGRAIVQKPKVFLFDEPLSNLDASLRVQMRIEIARLHLELGSTMIYVTHDQTEAMTLADRIVVLRAGQVEQVGTPIELYYQPDNLFVAGFIGSPKMNTLSAKIAAIQEGSVTVALEDGTQIAVTVDAAGANIGDEVTLGVRPEHLKISPTAGSNALSGITLALEQLGEASMLYLEVPGMRDTFVARMPALFSSKPGERSVLHFKPEHGFLFKADGSAMRRLHPLAE
jgi:multiple sugar transport system ATP-binding protein